MIGILGGGQLAQMLALAGIPLGLRFRILDPDTSAPAAALAEHHPVSFTDTSALDRFAMGLTAITYEFENVPIETARHLERKVPVYPPPRALEVAQDRLNEKTLFRELGIDTPAFFAIDSVDALRAGLLRTGFPAVLKTRRLGYDGKGQVVLKHQDQAAAACAELGTKGLILEAFVPFDRELSIIAVRDKTGDTRFYPLAENHHRGGILRVARTPAPNVSPELERSARELAGRLLSNLNYVGVLTVELFECAGKLLANEIAPRVHNSGHGTIEGALTSQFENHLRAVAELPLGDTTTIEPVTMLNLIGGIPPVEQLLHVPGAHLHLYGKEPRPGRKVGHLTLRDSLAFAHMDKLQSLVNDHSA